MKQILITVILCATALIALRIAVPKPAAKHSVLEAIHARRSIREYKTTPVEREKLLTVAKAGIAAPNAMNRQAWAVRIVDSKEWIDSCTAAFVESVKGTPLGDHLLTDSFRNMFRNAPTVAFIANDTTFAYSPVDCGLMAENMILSAWSMGIGSCCLGGPARFMKSNPEANKYLLEMGFSENYDLLLCIGFGYPAETPKAKPRDAAKVKFMD